MYPRPAASRLAPIATLLTTIHLVRRTRSVMDATSRNGTAHRRWAALSRTTSRQAIQQRAIPAIPPRTGWVRRSTTPISRSRTTVQCAQTATRFRPTTHNLRASIAIQIRRRTGLGCRILMFARLLRHAGTSRPHATTATRTVGVRESRINWRTLVRQRFSVLVKGRQSTKGKGPGTLFPGPFAFSGL